MAEETRLEQNDLQEEPKEFEVEELGEGDLEGIAGGTERVVDDVNNGCTVNNVAHC